MTHEMENIFPAAVGKIDIGAVFYIVFKTFAIITDCTLS